MRKLGLLMVLVFLSCNVWAQQDKTVQKDQVDPRIVEVYGDQLENMVLRFESRLNSLTKLLNERIVIEVLPYSEGEGFTKLSEVPLFNKYNKNLKRDEVFNPETFNALKYQMAFFTAREKVIYRVDNTSYIVKILSQFGKK